jgi:hypothetical protein
MPAREAPSATARVRERTDVYSLLLIIASFFLALAIALTWIELSSHYHFMGSTGEAALKTEEEAEAEAAGIEVEEEAPPEGEALE